MFLSGRRQPEVEGQHPDSSLPDSRSVLWRGDCRAAANRLSVVNSPSSVVQNQYNGLGDRLQQTANGVGTNYTLDLNTGLTQVLMDDENIYLYGNGRIAQQDSTTDYFLNDALGSLRQMADAGGLVSYTANYDPYGVLLTNGGASSTNYRFTGEYTDSYIKLIYLRSRFYAPSSGRFLTRDSWQGTYNRPLSLNRWNYVENNPVNRTDPSGQCWYIDSSGNIGYNIFEGRPSDACKAFTEIMEYAGYPITTSPNDWINSLPPEIRNNFNSCKENKFHINQGSEMWMVVHYYSTSKGQYYETIKTGVTGEVYLLFGGGASVSLDNYSGEWEISGEIGLGEGFSIGSFKANLSYGVGFEHNISTGSFKLGATASAGPFDLFVRLK